MRKWSRREVLRSGGMAAGALGLGQGSWLLGQEAAPGTTVTTSLGALRGALGEGGVRVFKGVPFAEPPVGALRFRPTVAGKAWAGVRSATAFQAVATQTRGGAVEGSEDCLYLNVWAPAGKGPFPVYVWIHGGGYTGGSAIAPVFDGTEFAREGVVFVTVAYRLGVFGFMDLGPLLGPEYAGSGNNAIRDLVMALRWVQGNIGAFGGDAARVTIGGESAGAKASAALMGIQEAKGMFQQVISESGGGERVWPKVEAEAVALEFGEVWHKSHLGDGSVWASGVLLPELTTAPVAELMAAQERLIRSSARHFPLRPEVDGVYLTATPTEVVGAGMAKGKRMILGTNLDESALFLGPHPQTDPTQRDLGNLSLAKFDAVFAKYKALYPAMPEARRRIRAVTAEEYWVPSVRLAEAFTGSGGVAWMYRLDYAKMTGQYAGEAYHSEDVSMVFQKPDPGEDAAGVALGRAMHAAWVAFIKGSVPGAAGLPSWPSNESGKEQQVMLLDRVSRVAAAPMEAELALWEGVM